MLGEEAAAMDKKSTARTVAPLSAKAATENKLKQDGSSSGRFPRFGRRRESSSNHPEHNITKPIQKTKNFDKRPRPHGGYYNENNRNQVAAANRAEVGSALWQGSKKQNLNHLLNFTYVNSPNHQNQGWNGNRNKWVSTKKHKYNKEEFLQANCQFVVKDVGDYSAYSSDPDRLVDWNLIEQVRLLCNEIPSCPICLYEPVAAKITRCGHVYCWSCILHYLALSDQTWRKCPICYESIHKNDLKSVSMVAASAYSVGDEITMCLMKKEKSSVLSLPKAQWKGTRAKPFKINEGVDTRFLKLLLASPADVKKLIREERKQLENAFQADKDCPEVCFIETAITMLKEREVKLMQDAFGSVDCSFLDPKPDVHDASDVATIGENGVSEACGENLEEAHSDEEEEESLDVSLLEEFDEMEAHVNAVNEALDDFVYFYQASDGRHIYMTSLNLRMLTQQYGSLKNAPETIVARIIERDSFSMQEELRKKLRRLCHLPLTCEIEVVELDLKLYIAPDVLKTFSDELTKRKMRREKRARDERKHNKKARENENKKWGRYPSAKIHLESYSQFPPNIGDNSWPVPSEEQKARNSDSSVEQSPYSGTPESVGGSSGARSFAQMLREGKAKPDEFPTLSGKALDGAKGKAATGAAAAALDEDATPSYNQSFSTALYGALDKVSKGEEAKQQKKKKGRHTLLFTTNTTRGE